MALYYGSCVEFMQSGILICGSSGCGKSDLCLRLIDQGAKLVSDDQTVIENENNALIARCPANIKGLLEIRGIGIVEIPSIEQTEIRLKLILQDSMKIDRMPSKKRELIENVEIPVFELDAFSLSAIIKIKTLLLVGKGKRKIIT